MLKNVTFKNVSAFVEGNTKQILADMGLQPKHIEEQIMYRASLCSSCINAGKCEVCGCKVPGKLYVAKSCNPDKFPDLMDNNKWEEFKKNLNK
jgi:hypothetical protein